MATATVITNGGKGILIARQIGATPSQAEMKFAQMGTGGGSRTAAVTDTALTTPVESRVSETLSQVTTTTTGDTLQGVSTHTASAPRVVNEFGIFDASTAGILGFSATFGDINLAAADTLTFTAKTQLQ